MKTKSRKIWSIPIAALALVLMLAGYLAVSGIVQAQSPGTTILKFGNMPTVAWQLMAMRTFQALLAEITVDDVDGTTWADCHRVPDVDASIRMADPATC